MIGDIYKSDTFSNIIRSFANRVDLGTNDTITLLNNIQISDKQGVDRLLVLEGQLKVISDLYEETQKEEITVLFAQKQLEYIEAKGELISFRKTILGFVSGALNKFPMNEDIKEILSELINGYTYEETLYNLGYNHRLEKLHLDTNTLLYK